MSSLLVFVVGCRCCLLSLFFVVVVLVLFSLLLLFVVCGRVFFCVLLEYLVACWCCVSLDGVVCRCCVLFVVGVCALVLLR